MTVGRRRFLFGIAALPASSLLAGRPLPGLQATVYNGYELHTVLQTAGEGSSILLAPGNFGDIGQFVLASSNISVRVQNPKRTVLRSPLIVQGNQVDLDGLAFEEGVVLAGDGLTIVGSVFTGKGMDVSGVGAEVAGCELSAFTGRGICIKGSAQNPYIHHNYIHDSKGSGLGTAAIQVGLSMRDSNRRISARIDTNRIERCRGSSPETISIKSSGNVISGNTLTDCNNLCNRHSEDNIIQGNTLERCYGLIIHDARNRVVGNRLVSAARERGISIMNGDAPWNAAAQGNHPQAYDTFVSGNSGPLIVGAHYSGDNIPAANTTVESHDGSITLRSEVNTILPPGVAATPRDLKPDKKNKKNKNKPVDPVVPGDPVAPVGA
jgi:Chondroitinase B